MSIVDSHRHLVSLLLFLLVAATGCGLTGGGGPPPHTPVVPAGLEGRLLYTREGSLYRLGLATGQLTVLATQPELGEIATARWSPDGKQVAFTRQEVRERRFPVAEIWLADVDGANPRVLLAAERQGTFYQSPVWGPDGRTLYYLHSESRPGERVGRLERIDIASSQRETVIEEVGLFDVSPDGRYLALSRTTNVGPLLQLVELTSGARRDLVGSGTFPIIGAPRFDPTSQRVLFAASRGAGAQVEPSIPGLADWLRPAVAHAHGVPQDLWTVPVAGGAATVLLPLEADEPVAAWSPDGALLAILSSEALMVSPVTGGQPTRILVPGSHGTIDWAR